MCLLAICTLWKNICSGPLPFFNQGKMSIQLFCPFFNWVVCFSDVELYEFFVYIVLVFGFFWLHWVFIVPHRPSSCGMWDLSSPTRDRTRVPCIGRRILNHWTTREVPLCVFLDINSLDLSFANIFSHSRQSFHFVNSFLRCVNLFSLM